MSDTLCPKCGTVLLNAECPQCGYAAAKQEMGRLHKYAIYIVVGVLIGGGYIKACKEVALELESDSTKYSESNAKWSRHALRDIRISIELPGEFKPVVSEIPPEMKQQVEQFKVYQYKGGILSIGVTYFMYTEGLIAIPADAAEAAVKNWRNLEDITDFQYTILSQDQDKVYIRGSFTRNNQKLDITELFVGQGQELWHIVIANNQENAEALAASTRIISSIKFN